MKKLYLLTLFFVSLSCPVLAQDLPLGKGLSEEETGLVQSFSFRNNRRTPPPVNAVRTAAEWEEMEYLVITWEPYYDNILRQIVAVGVNECKVVITTQDEENVAAYLTDNGIDLTNVIFLDESWDSIWIRDYSGNTVYTDDVGERALVDWIYNRPRPSDNVLPEAHAELAGASLYVTDSGSNDLVNTGGNFMTDGLGTAFASELVLDENGEDNDYGVTEKTEEDIDNIMEQYMGIHTYIKMPVLPYDMIHHIDMHMKLLDEETILVSSYPEGVADGPQIEANIDYVLENFMSPFGTPYRIKWIDAPPSTGGNYPDTDGYYRTYSNMVIINKSILIPTYRPEVDEPALEYLQELMPGYNIVGIDVDDEDEQLIASSGAIHCITHSIGVADPLLIVHQPVREASSGAMVAINASIKHASGISGAKVLWRDKGTDSFNETAMSLVEGDDWAAEIPTNADGTDAEYYIWAEAVSGKTLTRPLVAPDGFWTIETGALSTEEWAAKKIVGPYPNPATDAVNFTLDNLAGPMMVTINNILGQELYSAPVPEGNGIITLQLNPEWSGHLLITFKGDFGQVTKKLVKL